MRTGLTHPLAPITHTDLCYEEVNPMTLIKYMNTVRRYGYGVSTCPTAYQKDHYFCRNNQDTYPTIRIVHSRKQIERMSPDDLEGELIVRMFVVQ